MAYFFNFDKAIKIEEIKEEISMYKSAIQEKRFEYKGYPCVVLMQSFGFRTGYVGLKKGHKYYGVNYMDIPIDCHGGLTYSESMLIDQNDDDIWWIGFDTAHFMDGKDWVGCLELFKNYPETIKQIEQLIKIDFFNKGCIFSLEMMEEELKTIVNQLIC